MQLQQNAPRRINPVLLGGLLTGLLMWAGAALAFEALSNNNLSEAYIGASTPATEHCKPSTSTANTPTTGNNTSSCPVLDATGPLQNAAQDIVVKQTLAEDAPRSLTPESNPLLDPGALMAIGNALSGNNTSPGANTPGQNTGGGWHPH